LIVAALHEIAPLRCASLPRQRAPHRWSASGSAAVAGTLRCTGMYGIIPRTQFLSKAAVYSTACGPLECVV